MPVNTGHWHMVDTDKRISLRQWIWRAFLHSALIPLLLVETVLIAAYLLTNSAIRDSQIEYLRESARSDLRVVARQESRVIDQQLAAISALTRMYANETGSALRDPRTPPLTGNLALTATGVHYSPKDDGRPAVFYSSAYWKKSGHDLKKLAKLEHVDGLMRQIKTENPLVSAIYFNAWDSLNYIYPWFLTPEQYDHAMPIPEYNFYYLADAKHNPQRGVVWTDVYVDPAGQGWMMSSIAPVYRGDFLEGVVGLDVTVGTILDEINDLEVPWNGYAVLVSRELNIMALPKAGEADFGLTELTDFTYNEAINKELYKPSDFNLGKRKDTLQLARAMQAAPAGIVELPLGGKPHLVAWTTIDQTGWRLMTVVAEEDIFRKTNELAGQYKNIGYLLIIGLVLFYAVFFTYMWLRARQLSVRLQQPMAGVSEMLERIGGGDWRPQRVNSEIAELDDMAGGASAMGLQLERSEAGRNDALQRIEVVLEGATESLWEHDFRTNTVKVRGRLAQFYGLSSDCVPELEFRSHVHPDDVERAIAAKLPAIDGTSDRYASEFRFADGNGRYHWLLSRGRVLERDPLSGRALLIAGTHLNIDELKRTEDELRKASFEAEAASQAKSRFISSMTHELRTPLNAIQGFAQLMRMQKPKGPESEDHDYLDEILSASSHLNQLVGDILDWSSLQADAPKIDLVPVDVRDVMQDCAELVRVQVEQKGLVFNLDLPVSDCQVLADSRRLRQVLLNLVSNAIKYNTPGGQVTLSYQIGAGHVRLIVEDTGLGIAPDLQDQLFQPFQRLGRENTAILGTGIGLSLCREFAQMMRGRMGVHSEPGIGSSFWIELPYLGADGRFVPVPDAAGVLPSVFYVEDDPASQFLVGKALGDIAEVHMASDGRVALERILATPPALVLLDFNLPGLNGEGVLRQLRQHAHTRDLPVIVLSAAAEAERVLDMQCQGLLAKPVDIEELRGLVGAILQKGQSNA